VHGRRKKLKKYVYLTISVAFVLLLYIPGAAFAGKITGTVKVRGLRSPANILVYLTKAPTVSIDLSKTKFVMDQQNLTFLPHVLPIPVGATVLFPNNDKVDHNVFSLSRSNKFNLGNYKPGERETVRFDNPGIVELRCDLHAEMLAYILVLRNSYFAVTDAKGRFEIPDSKYSAKYGTPQIENLPAGKYTIKTWHEKLKTGRQKVTVPDNGDVSIQWNLTRGTPSVLYKR
jgi:plastocyanin